MKNRDNLTLGEILLKKGLITKAKLQQAVDLQKKTGEKLGRILIQSGAVSPGELYGALEDQLGVRFVRKIPGRLSGDAFSDLSEEYCRSNLVAPVRTAGGSIRVYVCDPLNQDVLNQISFMTGGSGIVEYATEQAVTDYLDRIETAGQGGRKPQGAGKTGSGSAVRVLQDILQDAVRRKVSDVHLEVFQKTARLLYRRDGVLREEDTISRDHYPALISRIKILSELDIAEKRLPQDGRFTFESGGRTADIRVSIMPSVHGENAVLRILDQGKAFLTLDRIGCPDALLALLKKESRRPQGLVLVTGPTGSGKTTTLYALLDDVIKSGQRKILTIEDPVEYRMNGVTQVQVHPEIGLTFAAGLRSFLRHDPDVMLVGEIRDRETAEIALRASLTGHLVLSTLHTNDSASTLVRLADMGIPPYLVSATVSLIVAQRLVRRVCPKCRVMRKMDKKDLDRYGVRGDFRPAEKGAFVKGCKSCGGTGYQGRVPVFEWLKITDAVKKAFLAGASRSEIGRLAARDRMPTLRGSGLSLVKAGLTTLEEIARVTALGD